MFNYCLAFDSEGLTTKMHVIFSHSKNTGLALKTTIFLNITYLQYRVIYV